MTDVAIGTFQFSCWLVGPCAARRGLGRDSQRQESELRQLVNVGDPFGQLLAALVAAEGSDRAA